MATLSKWVEGARPRTLPAAVAPVLVGTGAAFALSSANAANALLALLVSLALQVGVNYANDYSDGIRGTDHARVGPVRLVGQRLATAANVKLAAMFCFGAAAVIGLALVALSEAWWMLLVGAASIVAAWYYTGGKRPYGYSGFGELFVFVFFGLVAVTGSAFAQLETWPWQAFVLGVPVGLLASAILVVNNIRDMDSDRRAGKRTLAVRLGRAPTRTIYALMVYLAYLVAPLPWLLGSLGPWLLAPWLTLPLAVRLVRTVRRHADGPTLNEALAQTGMLQLAFGLLLSAGVLAS
jgi:1,4-dihydroxy-2-naphthoate octaprenyltransferase